MFQEAQSKVIGAMFPIFNTLSKKPRKILSLTLNKTKSIKIIMNI